MTIMTVMKGTKAVKGARPRGLVLHLSLIVGVVLSLFPFYWTVVMSTHTTSEIFQFPPKLLPGSHFDENVSAVLDNIDFFG
jgi:cellobiose transport system permease protein